MTGRLVPRLVAASLAAVVAVVAAGLLGWWQLGSWRDQRAAEAFDPDSVPTRPLVDVLGPDDPFPGQEVGRPVSVSGSWLPGATVFVSGRAHEGRDGFWMVEPLTVGGPDDPAVPVVLGWVASPADAPPPVTGDGDLTAYLQPTEGTGALDADPDDDVLPQLRIADVVQRVDQDLYGAYAVARDGVAGLPPADLAAVPDVAATAGLRNLLYALEWWVFAGFAVFAWWRYVRDLRAEAADAAGAGAAEAAEGAGEAERDAALASSP